MVAQYTSCSNRRYHAAHSLESAKDGQTGRRTRVHECVCVCGEDSHSKSLGSRRPPRIQQVTTALETVDKTLVRKPTCLGRPPAGSTHLPPSGGLRIGRPALLLDSGTAPRPVRRQALSACMLFDAVPSSGAASIGQAFCAMGQGRCAENFKRR
ncbi:hypothetical protein BCR34DRAFT_631119 [Clohesyomyces aquaticus]|uniref:Uncharacterized protein n=1 Tax=Clohesyomyces aquaticus TaxID=1231657 RepID=A0A1Y1ZB61_9PLEO|nr:hypothetical protein BCR34DRAFT_631119 [Clohesyomyces aquaticus]